MKLSRVLFFAIISSIIIGLPACWGESQVKEEPKKQGLIVINVLDKQLFEDCHIKGSINLQLEDLEKFAANLDKDSAEVVVYCSNYMCSTSKFVTKKLEEMGVKHVWAYEGGMAEWYQLGLPYEGPAKSAYLAKENQKLGNDEQEIRVLSANQLHEKIKSGGIAKW